MKYIIADIFLKNNVAVEVAGDIKDVRTYLEQC